MARQAIFDEIAQFRCENMSTLTKNFDADIFKAVVSLRSANPDISRHLRDLLPRPSRV